jgi:hypothetical protein
MGSFITDRAPAEKQSLSFLHEFLPRNHPAAGTPVSPVFGKDRVLIGLNEICLELAATSQQVVPPDKRFPWK